LDPSGSCATAGMHVLVRNWGIDGLAPASLDAVWPYCFLAAEGLIVVLLVARPAFGIVLALLMHVPLTIVFAPAFAFVMIPGLFCLLGEDDVLVLGRTLRRHAGWIV